MKSTDLPAYLNYDNCHVDSPSWRRNVPKGADSSFDTLGAYFNLSGVLCLFECFSIVGGRMERPGNLIGTFNL